MVAQAYDPSIWWTVAGELLWVPGLPGLHSEKPI